MVRHIVACLLVLASGASAQQFPRPGVFTGYKFTSTFVSDLEIFQTWEAAPECAGVYPAFGFLFEARVGGYMGMVLGTDRKFVQMAIWDVDQRLDAPRSVFPHPSYPRTEYGGCILQTHEGPGINCFQDYDWVLGREYKLRLAPLGSPSGFVDWEGRIVDTVTGIEAVIGVIRTADTNGLAGYGRLHGDRSLYTFLEYFGNTCETPTSCGDQPGEVQPYTRTRWRGPFADNGSKIPLQAQAAYNSCTSSQSVSACGWLTVTHEIGTGVNAGTERDQMLRSPEMLWAGICPDE